MFNAIDVLLPGFPGKGNIAYLGWSTCALLRAGDRVVLLDASSAGGRPMLIDVFKARGLKYNDVTDVFISHLHFDHAANCTLFPHATFHMSRAEWEYANTSNDIFVNEGALVLLRSFKKNFIEEDGQDVFEGVKAYLTPGHTPGSTSLVGCDDLGRWAFTGDAIKNRSELDGQGVGMTLNAQTSSASIDKVKGLADRVLPGHDCWLKLEDGKVFPEGGNDVTIAFPEGVTCNGKETLTLSLDM